MKNSIFLISFIWIFIFTSCDNSNKQQEEVPKDQVGNIDYMNRTDLENHILKLEKSLYEDTLSMDREKAKNLMEAYAMYADKHPDQENSAEYMFKAGELAMGLNHSLEAIKYFSITYGRYVNFDKRPYALFLKAFVLENQVKDFEQAKNTYLTFIEEYPDHPMRDDAEYSIKNMGKSPEELIREFEEKQSEEEKVS